jgi:hypothetical protein
MALKVRDPPRVELPSDAWFGFRFSLFGLQPIQAFSQLQDHATGRVALKGKRDKKERHEEKHDGSGETETEGEDVAVHDLDLRQNDAKRPE